MNTILGCGLTALGILAAVAVSAEGDQPQGRPPLPPGVIAQINLGKAGLLESFYSSEQFGTVQARIGLSRATIGAATAPFAPTTGYKDESSALVVPLNVLKSLPDGKSYIRFAGTGTFADGRPNLVELDGNVGRFDLQYLTFPNPDMMIGFGALVERSDMDIVGAGTVGRKGAGIRFV